jgi:aryl-alcohol dehydrogenase
MITEALLVREAGAPFSYQEISVDDNLRDDEVLVEMNATGVCHTDLNFSKEKSIPGLFPAVFGHEGKISNSLATAITYELLAHSSTANNQ